MCEEAKDSGIKTLVMLDDQGEQLEKFEKGVDGINADMRLAEEALKSMDLLCGIFPKFWKKSGGFKEDDAIWGDQKVRKKLSRWRDFQMSNLWIVVLTDSEIGLGLNVLENSFSLEKGKLSGSAGKRLSNSLLKSLLMHFGWN